MGKTINELSALDAVVDADQVPVYSSANGDARRVPASVLKAYVAADVPAILTRERQYSAPNATGFSVTIAPSINGYEVHLIITPAAGYAAGTIVMPPVADCLDGQRVVVTCTQAVTTLTISVNGAAAIVGGPTALTADQFFTLEFDDVTDNWIRVA